MSDPTTGLPVVGMVGGGQLARMTHQAAIPLGLSLRVLADSPTDSAALVAADVEVGPYVDLDVLRRSPRAATSSPGTTSTSPTTTSGARAEGDVVRPGSAPLHFAQDKLAMRRRLDRPRAAPSRRWRRGHVVRRRARVRRGARLAGGGEGDAGWLRRAGGVGARDPGRRAAARAAPAGRGAGGDRARARRLRSRDGRPARGGPGRWSRRCRVDGICVEVVAPATDLRPEVAAEAERIAMTVARASSTSPGCWPSSCSRPPRRLVVNELAMRPHNSGHWSIEGAVTSQFEQHLRAVLDWPLGGTAARRRSR